MSSKPQHASLTFERFYAAPVELVFAEFADPVTRARWSAPTDDALIYDEVDFQVGGRDVFRCGPKGDLRFRGETRYLNIVPNAQVVSVETVDMNGERLGASLATLTLEPADGGTRLALTVQVVSFVGAGLIQGHESGHKSALDNLAQHLQNIRRV